jgi:hypothetical protein
VSRVIIVELDSAAEAALNVLTAQGNSVDEAVQHALVVAAKNASGASAPSDANDDITGLA